MTTTIESTLDNYRRAFSIRHDDAEAHYNLATLLHNLEYRNEAEACYRHTLSICPIHAQAHNNLGNLFQELNRPAEAESCYRRALYIQRNYAEAEYNLGILLQKQNRVGEAEACYLQALSLRPDYAEAHNNLATLFQKLKRFTEAEDCYRRALSIRPDYPEANYNLGNLLQERMRFPEAERSYQRALDLRPEYVLALNNLGILLQALNRHDAAEACYLRARSIDPDYPEIHNNLGVMLKDLKRFDEAERCFKRALSLCPDYADATWNLGILFLFRGQFEEGWPLFEARHDKNFKQATYTRPDVLFPSWSGEDLHGKSILIWPEQGFGDELQFIRYLPLLKGCGVTRITLVCKSALKSLFLYSASEYAEIISLPEAGKIPDHDFWTRLLSLPLFFKTTRETIPATLPYLAAPADKTRQWEERLPRKGFKVGLAWKGNAAHKNDANRSLPGLFSLAPLWSVSGITFISLQKGAEEAATPCSAQPMMDPGPDMDDFSDTAAIVSQLDLVICVDTAVAHVAGALGTPCWVLLPFIGTDWRWMNDGEGSPWYPGVMRLFRQREINNWDRVVEEVGAALERLVANGA
jgi:tetratricopeptide (TPR) repeat protein